MAPFGIWGNSGKGPSKATLDGIRAKQEARKRADQELTAGKGSKQPIVSQPGHGSMMSATGAGESRTARRSEQQADPQGADAHSAPSGGFLSFVRDCCPTLPFDRWFGGSRRGDLEAASDPGAYHPIADSNRGRGNSRGENIPLLDRMEGSPTPLAGAEPAAGSAASQKSRRQTLPSDSTGSVRFESQFEADASARERPEGSIRKRRHSEAPAPGANEVNLAQEEASAGKTRKPSMPQPEGWTLSGAAPRREREMPPAAERNAETFKQFIRDGYSPLGAAKMMGPGTVPKLLKASDGIYEIRLNQHHRLTYRTDTVTKELTILEIGGHT